MERFTLDLGHILFYTNPVHTSNNDIEKKIVRAGTLDGPLMALCGVTDTEFPDLADPQTRDHACTHRIIGALLMPVFV